VTASQFPRELLKLATLAISVLGFADVGREALAQLLRLDRGLASYFAADFSVSRSGRIVIERGAPRGARRKESAALRLRNVVRGLANRG
jgi:hypothetical protein